MAETLHYIRKSLLVYLYTCLAKVPHTLYITKHTIPFNRYYILLDHQIVIFCCRKLIYSLCWVFPQTTALFDFTDFRNNCLEQIDHKYIKPDERSAIWTLKMKKKKTNFIDSWAGSQKHPKLNISLWHFLTY